MNIQMLGGPNAGLKQIVGNATPAIITMIDGDTYHQYEYIGLGIYLYIGADKEIHKEWIWNQ